MERAAAGIGLYVNAHKTEYMCYNQTGDISTLDGTPLKLGDKFTYLGSSVASTEKDINTRLIKAWTAINRLSIIWKSDLTDKMKCSFFQAAVASILLYICTTWTLTKQLEKKLDGNYTRMLRAILNKSWRQHPTRHQLYGHLPPIMKTIQVRRTRHAGKCWRSRDELISDVFLWTPHTLPCKSRTTSTNIHSATMWGYRMLSRRPVWGDERYGKVAREGQGYLCYQHDMMMMMISGSLWQYLCSWRHTMFILCSALDVVSSGKLVSLFKVLSLNVTMWTLFLHANNFSFN